MSKRTPRWVTSLRLAHRDSKAEIARRQHRKIMADFNANDAMERAGKLEDVLEAVNNGMASRSPVKQLREIARLANYCRLPELVVAATAATVREAPRRALGRLAKEWS